MRILVIEDEKEIRDSLKRALESQAFAVDTAEDGERGSFLGRTNEYDLIILDNIMPKKEGFEVCQDIRKSGKTTPILMLSVMSEIHDKVNLLESGADDYLTKPFSLNELLARIRAILRRPRMLQEENLQLGDLILDRKQQIARRGTKNIYLTRKEFALLEYLLQHYGQVVPRHKIVEHIWDSDHNPFSNTLETHILNLRKKIELPKKKKLIRNVPGRGYKIE